MRRTLLDDAEALAGGSFHHPPGVNLLHAARAEGLEVQWMTLLNPMRYFMEVVRGVFLKGVGVEVLWPQLLMLGVFGVFILGFSAMRFRKRLD